VIAAPDVSVIYELPIALHSERCDEQIAEKLNIWSRPPDLSPWQRVVDTVKSPPKGVVSIALVGKYVHLRDSYKSLHEALVHGAIANDAKIDVKYVDSEPRREQRRARALGLRRGLVPGGFGGRGAEGKIQAIRFAREKGVPFFGICLGLQMAVIEYARHVCGIAGANSDGVRSELRRAGDRPHARPARGQEQGRHDAPRGLPLRAQGAASPRASTAAQRSPSATATATSSTTPTASASRSRAS
jgi:CTP synthase (UTP-ammonia lyase)